MSRVLSTGGLGFLSRLANIRPLAAAREVQSTEDGLVREVQPSREMSSIEASLDPRAESLDAVAGSEFVDDRIRLRE